jgi:HAD superfamily hydrolase (TIGR01450 family)
MGEIHSLMPIKTFIFDLNGTIWFWNKLADDTEKVLSKLKKDRRKIYFVTNNCHFSREELALKLSKLGVSVSMEQIISSGYAAAKYFEVEGIRKVNIHGSSGLISEFESLGIEHDSESMHILLSYDRNFNYAKLKEIYDKVSEGAKIYTTGIDTNLYVGSDIYPAEMPMIKAIKEFVDAPVLNLGLPSKNIKSRLLEDVFLFPEDTILIGDNIETNIKFGNSCGFKTALLLGGFNTKDDVELSKYESKPDMILNNMKDILKRL